MKNENHLDSSQLKSKIYYCASFAIVIILAFLFAFPLYWIITGAFKSGAEINSSTPVRCPTEWVTTNF